ncbi:MAG: copper chaperone PCu(A)C [Neomegalonema sp.]|nr:copper chaperone PCu(A)C [Neomegalonema sp.]
MKFVKLTACALLAGLCAPLIVPAPHAFAEQNAPQAHADAAPKNEAPGGFTFETPILRTNIGKRPSAGFVTIHNPGPADRLLAAASPLFGYIELHTHRNYDGVMRMEQVEAIEVPAQGSVALQRGGLHLMMFDPLETLPSSGMVPVTLRFESAGEITIEMPIQTLGSRPQHQKMEHKMQHKMHHGTTN